ncbi:hypothetical protein P7C70_g9084, partial [Phenoliferia sp. Uapishka_3]
LSIDVLPPLPPSSNSTRRIPPSRSTSHLSAPSSDWGTMHSTRTTQTTQTIYHTPSSSLTDNLSSPSLSFSSLDSSQTLRPPVSPAMSSSTSSTGDYFEISEEVSQRKRDEERAHGIDIYMATSPPREPPGGLPRSRFSVYRNPTAKLLEEAEGGEMVVPRSQDPVIVEPLPTESNENQSHSNGNGKVAKTEVEDTYDYASDGIKHFRTSAKTGEGVRDVFEYAARRVMWKWRKEEKEEEEEMKRAREHQESFGLEDYGQDGKGKKGWKEACC